MDVFCFGMQHMEPHLKLIVEHFKCLQALRDCWALSGYRLSCNKMSEISLLHLLLKQL